MAPVVANKGEEAVCSKNEKQAEKSSPMANSESWNHGMSEIVEATKAANAFPQAAARDLYCAYPTFGRIIDEQSDRILGLISKVLKMQNIKGNIQRRQQDEQFEMLLECNDAILERVNSNLDELAGIKKNPQTIVIESQLSTAAIVKTGTGKGAGSWNLKRNDGSPVAARLITAKNIARPQLRFKVPVDNLASTPFVPKLKDKPNSLKPLAILPEYDEDGNICSYLHPYEFELMKFEVPEALLKRHDPQPPSDVKNTPLVYVDTVATLKTVVAELKRHKQLAIDVEHHSYRTFLGFTCLIQISTRVTDYLFDALELRDELHVLNEVLTDARVVKIFHGADSDIEWLQRDLSLYVVNLFDTHQAAKALNFARLSLSYLLKHYCDIEADKTFQLADWRIRPLPAELVAYARQDTHFLIYIYERITNDLLDAANKQTNVLRTIYQRSTELCKKRYSKPVARPDSHMDFFRKTKRTFDNRQLYALCELFQWRDSVARHEDESYGYVLPNHMMLQIAESLPREMQGILACCNPIPPLVRQHLHKLHQIILYARDQPLVKPILDTVTIHRVVLTNTKDYNSKLHCPHDLSHCEEFRNDLATLLNFKEGSAQQQPTLPTLNNLTLCKPKLSLFDTPQRSVDIDATAELDRRARAEKVQFISPYQRYLAVLPLVEKEKREEAARLEVENKNRQLCPAAEVLPLKQEVNEQTEANVEDDMYSVPVKEYLKRKYEQVMTDKAQNVSAEIAAPPRAKRSKTEQNKTPNDAKLKFVNLSPPKKEQKQTRASVQASAQVAQAIGDSDDSNGPPIEMPSTSQTQPSPMTTQGPQQNNKINNQTKRQLTKRNRKGKFQSQQKPAQSSDRPVQANFDYKKVDFKKFQGGAQRAKGTELKPQFHGKSNSNKANNKKFNKLFTFSNVKGSKK